MPSTSRAPIAHLLAVVIAAAGPLLAFASGNIGLQKTVSDDHAALGHYGFMAAFCFTVIGVGLLASLRPDGWRLPTWVAGLLPVLLGLASLAFPNVESSLSRGWALVAIAWGVAFVVVAELTAGSIPMTYARHDTDGVPDRKPTTNAPRLVYVLGVIAIILVVLFVLMHLTGGGFGAHALP